MDAQRDWFSFRYVLTPLTQQEVIQMQVISEKCELIMTSMFYGYQVLVAVSLKWHNYLSGKCQI